jgi:small subunit ribosomal protein S7
MSRSSAGSNRIALPDPKYGSTKVTKLINRCMKDGKKSVAQAQVYLTFEILKEKLGRDPMEIFEDSLRSVTPLMEVRARRVGGAAYQVPMPVRGSRGFSLALRWLIGEARKRPSTTYHSFAEKLAAEMMDSLKKKMAVHKMADANKAFAHFRW